MTDPTRSTGSPARTGTPRWVKVSGIIAIIVAVLFVILLIFGGNHGPDRHASSGGRPVPAPSQTAPST